MKLKTVLNSTLAFVAFSSLLLISLAVKAEAGDPNGSQNTPQSGWSLWQRWEKLQDADVEFGLSNLDLGLDLELQNQCFGEVGTAKTDRGKVETYWYRVSDDVSKIGTGQVEYGCWIEGRFITTITTTAIKSSLSANPCFQVSTDSQTGLTIHAEPSTQSPLLQRVQNGETVKPSSVPVIVRTEENQSWIEVEAPVKGWISNGNPNGKGNLTFCQGSP